MNIAASFRRAAAVTVVVAIAIITSGCTGDDAKPKLPPVAAIQLHPHGDPGAWMKDAYADGASRTYATVDTVCGIFDDLVLESRVSYLYGSSVVARTITSGVIQWEAAGVSCNEGSFTPDVGLVVQSDERGAPLELLDPLNGVSQTLPVGLTVKDTRALTVAGDITVYETGTSNLLGVRGDQVVWTYYADNGTDFYALADGKIGVTKRLEHLASAVDGATGKELFQRELTDSTQRPVWASDGLVLSVDQNNAEYSFIGMDGVEVAHTKDESQYRFVPSPGSGVTFPLADHVDGGTVVAVAADGSPAFFEGPQRKTYTQTGPVDLAKNEGILDIMATSADGQLFLYELRLSKGIEVRDAQNKVVFTWVGDLRGVRIVSGYIVLKGQFTTTILLPGK